MKSFIFMVPTFSWYDAVGNDTAGMAESLCADHRASVFAECGERDDLPRISFDEIRRLSQIPQNVIIYQHCVDWPKGEEILSKAKCRIVIRYQNITPYRFFERYSNGATAQCRRGEEQTKRLWQSLPGALWLPNSKFTASTLPNVPVKGTVAKVLAPYCPDLKAQSASSGISPRPRKSAQDVHAKKAVQLLFVGRQAPNKGHAFLIEAAHRFRTFYKRDIDLRFVGRLPEPFFSYGDELKRRVEFRGLRDHVVFEETASNEQLLDRYRTADFFVCASEHEGFGVPLVEAQREGLPVVAVAGTSVPETLGSGQIVLPRDPDRFAAALALLDKNPRYRRYLVEQGYRNCTRFESGVFRKTLTAHINAWLPQTGCTL